MLILHYFNDMPCFLMLNFAHYTLFQNITDPMSRTSMLGQSVTSKRWRSAASNTDILEKKTKMLRKYSKSSMFNILKTSLSLKLSNAYISNDIILMLYHILFDLSFNDFYSF